ncbi:unnamed protein product [Schistosoma mattheei]|uniref:Uncharacterized protein n=1 Tax=Schistosoma mattheei TaxID=31246 RepID=A0A183P1I7_9TREM|nr:unnamed protein product [Schistosoma mattheei]
MVGGGSRQEILDPGFVLLGTRRQGVLPILRESVLPDGFISMIGSSQQETLDPRFVLFPTRQQGVLVILRELVLPDEFDPVSPSFIVRDVITELSGSQPDGDQSFVNTFLLSTAFRFLMMT